MKNKLKGLIQQEIDKLLVKIAEESKGIGNNNKVNNEEGSQKTNEE